MNWLKNKTRLVLALLLALAGQMAAAAPLTDGVLGRLEGDWSISGVTRGKPTATGARVRAVFGGTFLEMHIKDPAGRIPYEAKVYIGQDERGGLVAHWLDGTGGGTSRTLGTGSADGDTVRLDFPYPEGLLRDRLSYDRARDRWRLLIETGTAERPEVFADWYFERVNAR